MSGLGLGVRGCLPFGLLPPRTTSRVGHAGVGVISMRRAPSCSSYLIAAAQLKRFLDCGRAVRCMLPLGFGRFVHLVVLYRFQGADTDAEQLALTEQLFDAAFGELSVVARGQPCLLDGDFNVEPTKIPCLAKGIPAGLCVDFEKLGLWLLVCSQPLLVNLIGILLVVIAGISWLVLAVAAVLSCKLQADRWIAPHLAVRTLFDCCRWTGRVTQPVQRIPLWPASWLPAIDKSRGSKSVEVQKVWEVHDERLQFMSRQEALQLDESLDTDDISRAWLVWSGAAEAALAGAYRFSGVSPFLVRVWFLAGGVLRFGSSDLVVTGFGGRVVNVADAHDAADVFLYRDSSIAPLLDVRRRFKAVMDVLDAMIRYGVSLSRSVELAAQWDRILAAGPLYPVTLVVLSVVRGMGIGAFYHAAYGIHRRLSDFIHAVVVCRRDEAVRGRRNWIREDPMVHPYRWLRPVLVPLSSISSV